jgi:hypothetical protein
MNTEDGQSVLSEVSVNTDNRVFNGGITMHKDNNLKIIPKTVSNNINNGKQNIFSKLANGLQELSEPISFRPNTCDVVNNCSIDLEKLNIQNECELEENVFNNLKDKIHENQPTYEYKFKSNNSSTINCTISTIEKGIAILVTKDDTIFTLPAFFLPKNSMPGNSYQISIDETMKMQSKVTNIHNIQKKLKRKEKSFFN